MYRRTSPQDGKSYAIGFEMRLPEAWNGRFFYQANGGLDGRVTTALGGGGPMPATALEQGFAVISSDAGHSGPNDASFGIDNQARLDYGYQATAKLTPMAKALIAAAYGKAPDRSYIGGCSNGGRYTVRRDDTDASGVRRLPGGSTRLPPPARRHRQPVRGEAVRDDATDPTDLGSAFTAEGACDPLRRGVGSVRCAGWRQGWDDPGHPPHASPPSTSRASTCLPAVVGVTAAACRPAQKRAIAPIFSGAVDGKGEAFYSSFRSTTGTTVRDSAFWEFLVPLRIDSAATALIWGVPPENPSTFDGRAYALSTPLDAMLKSVAATDGTYSRVCALLHVARPAHASSKR